MPNSPTTEAVGACSWCAASKATSPLPDVFIFTKMEAESGQPIQTIRRRKDFERLNGGGLFYWGIGTSIDVGEVLKRSTSLEVVFSLMRAKPRQTDVSPKGVLLWTQFLDADGAVYALPPHALVLSNAHTAKQSEKERYYALVCHSSDSLFIARDERLGFAHLRNFNGDKKPLGFSQITAVVEHVSTASPGVLYPATMRAELKSPYCAKLREPVLLDQADRHKITAVADDPELTPRVWGEFVASLRARYA
jgi:hypothetical protein